MSRNAPPWVYELDGNRDSKKAVRKRIKKHEKQRIERGYSVFDWWSFDTYITRVLADAVRDFRKRGTGYPGHMTVKEWNRLLKEIEDPLRAYSDNKFGDLRFAEGEALEAAAKEAMKLFAENLGSMWD